MTDNDNAQTDAGMPAFSVNVVPTAQIRSEHLASLLKRFRQGEVEPLVFGDQNRPEAAVVPFSDLVRLMKADHAAEQADQAELSRRIQASDQARARGEEPGTDLDALGDELGEPARSIIRGLNDDDQ